MCGSTRDNGYAYVITYMHNSRTEEGKARNLVHTSQRKNKGWGFTSQILPEDYSAWTSFLFQALVHEVLAYDKTFLRCYMFDTDNCKLIILIMYTLIFFNSYVYVYMTLTILSPLGFFLSTQLIPVESILKS